MCIGSNSVNQAQDLMFVTKFEDFPNSLLPNKHSFKHSPVVIISLLMETTAIHLCNGTRPANVQAEAPSVSSSVEEVWPPTTRYTWQQSFFVYYDIKAME